MRIRSLVLMGTSLAVALLVGAGRSAVPGSARVVRLAELEIDPLQLEAYKVALREEIETSVKVEPGVLRLYAVFVKEHPAQIRLFEMYADQQAYEAHLQTAHFKTYKTKTAGMVKSLQLLEVEPIVLGSK